MAIKQALDHLLRSNQTVPVLDLDARVKKVINILAKEPEENFSQEYLATQVNLSPSRLLHLFKEQTGVPYRSYRTWKRLQHTMRNLYVTDNMTQSAISAGFSDAAHFSRRFRGAYGVSPSMVFHNVSRFEMA